MMATRPQRRAARYCQKALALLVDAVALEAPEYATAFRRVVAAWHRGDRAGAEKAGQEADQLLAQRQEPLPASLLLLAGALGFGRSEVPGRGELPTGADEKG